MAKEINMKNKSIHKMQNVLDKTIKVVKFAWRHFFVILTLVAMIFLVKLSSANWFNITISIAFAVSLDWLKTKIKFSSINNSQSHYHQAVTDSFRKHYEWATNPAKIGSPANHIYNLGYNPGKYL